jgi:osmotically-inducible protein OsmY
MNTDPQLQQEVTKKLQGYPKIDATHIRVAATKAGYVILGGYVRHFTEKVDAVQIAKSVKGVNSVTDDIDVIPPGQEVPKWHDSPLDFADGSDGGASEAGD